MSEVTEEPATQQTDDKKGEFFAYLESVKTRTNVEETPASPPPAVEKPKPKRYVKKKTAAPTPTPEEAPAVEPIPEPTAEPIPEPTPEPTPKQKAKAKPRTRKTPAKEVVIDSVEVQPVIETVPIEEVKAEEPVRPEEQFKMEAEKQIDTRSVKQKLLDMQADMKRLKREAKQTHYKKMLEGKL